MIVWSVLSSTLLFGSSLILTSLSLSLSLSLALSQSLLHSLLFHLLISLTIYPYYLVHYHRCTCYTHLHQGHIDS